jgi:hypothetical protein
MAANAAENGIPRDLEPRTSSIFLSRLGPAIPREFAEVERYESVESAVGNADFPTGHDPD